MATRPMVAKSIRRPAAPIAVRAICRAPLRNRAPAACARHAGQTFAIAIEAGPMAANPTSRSTLPIAACAGTFVRAHPMLLAFAVRARAASCATRVMPIAMLPVPTAVNAIETSAVAGHAHRRITMAWDNPSMIALRSACPVAKRPIRWHWRKRPVQPGHSPGRMPLAPAWAVEARRVYIEKPRRVVPSGSTRKASPATFVSIRPTATVIARQRPTRRGNNKPIHSAGVSMHLPSARRDPSKPTHERTSPIGARREGDKTRLWGIGFL